MFSYLLRRLIQSIFVLFGVSILVFLMIHLVPGDPVLVMLSETAASEQAIESMRANLGLDRPLPEQYFLWLVGNDFMMIDSDRDGELDSYGDRRGILRGDFGRSIFKRVPVGDLIAERFPATLRLALAAMAISVPLGVLAGVVAAVRRDTIIDNLSMLLALLGVSIPSFWLGMMLMSIFGVQLGWIRPFIGDRGLITLILPAVTLSMPTLAVTARLTRSSMLDTLNEDYIRTARAKGLIQRVVLYRHAFRNAIIPVITLLGLQFGFLLGGAVIVETVFAYPGLGREIVDAILQRDFPTVQGLTLFSGVIFVLINLVVDILYGFLDPRISYR